MRSIVISMSPCLFVCLFIHLRISETVHPNFNILYLVFCNEDNQNIHAVSSGSPGARGIGGWG